MVSFAAIYISSLLHVVASSQYNTDYMAFYLKNGFHELFLYESGLSLLRADL